MPGLTEDANDVHEMRSLFDWSEEDTVPVATETAQNKGLLEGTTPDEFFERYQRLILKLAHKFLKFGAKSFSELLEDGYDAFFKAIARYDKGYKTRFGTYAHILIQNQMRIRKPEPESVSFDDCFTDSDSDERVGLHEIIPSPGISPEQKVMLQQVWEAVEFLPRRQKAIVVERFKKGRTLVDIGNDRRICGRKTLTRERVRQLEQEAVKRLKEILIHRTGCQLRLIK